MAISPIIVPSEDRPKKDALDRIAQVVGIASNVLGTAVAVPEYLRKTRLAEEQAKREEARFGLEVATKTRPAMQYNEGLSYAEEQPDGSYKQSSPGRFEEGATEVPGYGMRMPLSQGGGLSDQLTMLKIFELKNELAPPDESDKELYAQWVGGTPPPSMNRGQLLSTVKTRMGKPDIFTNQTQTGQAKAYVEAVNSLPTIEARTQNIDDALVLLERVSTHPFTGKDVIAEWRRVFDKDFQQLEQSLNKEGIETVKAFAKEAGARAIDTEAERAYLERTQPGIKKHTGVNRSMLLSIKSLLERARLETLAKQQHVNSGGNMQNYRSPLDGKKAFYNPKNYEIQFFVKDIPGDDFVPLANRLMVNPLDEKDIPNPGAF